MMKKKQQEVFFVATANSENQYTFELDVNTAGKDSFGYVSGTYEMVNSFIVCWFLIGWNYLRWLLNHAPCVF